MYLPNHGPSSKTLSLLSEAAIAPSEICESDPDIQQAFEDGLRALAEDIVHHHPSLAHVLLGMSTNPCPFIHGQN